MSWLFWTYMTLVFSLELGLLVMGVLADAVITWSIYLASVLIFLVFLICYRRHAGSRFAVIVVYSLTTLYAIACTAVTYIALNNVDEYFKDTKKLETLNMVNLAVTVFKVLTLIVFSCMFS